MNSATKYCYAKILPVSFLLEALLGVKDAIIRYSV